jgi:hypothetical protein
MALSQRFEARLSANFPRASLGGENPDEGRQKRERSKTAGQHHRQYNPNSQRQLFTEWLTRKRSMMDKGQIPNHNRD